MTAVLSKIEEVLPIHCKKKKKQKGGGNPNDKCCSISLLVLLSSPLLSFFIRFSDDPRWIEWIGYPTFVLTTCNSLFQRRKTKIGQENGPEKLPCYDILITCTNRRVVEDLQCSSTTGTISSTPFSTFINFSLNLGCSLLHLTYPLNLHLTFILFVLLCTLCHWSCAVGSLWAMWYLFAVRSRICRCV